MFCKKCGRVIRDDSVFCQHCGANLKIESSHTNEEPDINQTAANTSRKESSTKTISRSSIIANEIAANTKMVGLALLLCVCFTGVFWAYHIKDRKPVSESHFGNSCYDVYDVEICNYETDWMNLYPLMSNRRNVQNVLTKDDYLKFQEYNKEYIQKNNLTADQIESQYLDCVFCNFYSDREDFSSLGEKFKAMSVGGKRKFLTYQIGIENVDNYNDLPQSDLSPEEMERVYDFAESMDPSAFAESKRVAIENAEFINSNRKASAIKDLETHLKYSILISLLITTLGRYIIIGIKWVAKNKTK